MGFLWNNDYIVKLINQNRQTLFPIIVGVLHNNSKQHWNSAVHGLTFNVVKLLMEVDPVLFDTCSAKHRADEVCEEEKQKDRDRCWKKLQELHDAKVGAK